MSESTDPQTRAIPKPEEMPWVIRAGFKTALR